MSDLWMHHLSVESWQTPCRWAEYFDQAQKILRSPLTHLDAAEPIRRRVTSLGDAGDYICALKEREGSRWLFGKFSEIGVEFTLQNHRGIDQWPNSLILTFPPKFVSSPESYGCVKALFDSGNHITSAFYSFVDERQQVSDKNKSLGAVNIEEELIGVFWITYFNASYVAFFGREKFENIADAKFGANGDVTVLLGDSPSTIPSGIRERLAIQLGKESFVEPSDEFYKPRGRFALTLQELLIGRQDTSGRGREDGSRARFQRDP